MYHKDTEGEKKKLRDFFLNPGATGTDPSDR